MKTARTLFMLGMVMVFVACGDDGGTGSAADAVLSESGNDIGAEDPFDTGQDALDDPRAEAEADSGAEVPADPGAELPGDLGAEAEADATGPAGLEISVDPGLRPAVESLPGPGGAERPVARMVGASGTAMDFVLGELLVGTDDPEKLEAFKTRWGATVVETVPAVGGMPSQHLLRLDPSGADLPSLLAELADGAPDLTGTFVTSSDAAARLLAVALAEANRLGLTVTPNFLFSFDAIEDGTALEAPTGDEPGYSQNAFEWPYMDRGSAQDIGVGAAWQALQRAGKLGNRVKIMIWDGGFAPNDDFPADRQVFGDWNVPNPAKCGDSDCPWHGTMVTTVAMGRPDNGFGAAGPAGPIAQLVAVPFASDFFGLLSTLERLVGGTFLANPRIINMSFSFGLDLGWDIAVKATCLWTCPSLSETAGSISAAVAATGKMLFASAGNLHKDVDDNGANPEGATTIPCELPGVYCVGRMVHGGTALDGGSNLGSQAEDDSVDIYGPFWAWVGPTPDATANHARLMAGTSFSSPFVAGVAALVWAANPSLSAGEVWQILRDTAHVGGVGVTGYQRRINAFGAVARVLGGAPPTVTLSGPAVADLNREAAFTAVANDPEYGAGLCPPSACPLTWTPTPNRVVGNTAYYRFSSVGSQTITVVAKDAIGQTATQSKTVDVVNSPPVVSISQPLPGARPQQGVPVQLLGTATDVNEGPGPGPGPLPCRWTSSVASDSGFPMTGCNRSATFESPGPRTLTMSAADSQGLTTSVRVSITVDPPPTNLPPVITLGSLPETNYNGGYSWDMTIEVTASATDPEGNLPISYTWRATSLRPNSETVWAADVVVQGPSTTAALSWKPENHPVLFGDFGALPDCYSGQVVRLALTATDSLGNASTRSLPDFKVFRCILF